MGRYIYAAIIIVITVSKAAILCFSLGCYPSRWQWWALWLAIDEVGAGSTIDNS